MLVARALLGLSLSRPASGVAIITGSGERDGWLMAVGIHLGDFGLRPVRFGLHAIDGRLRQPLALDRLVGACLS